LPLVGDKAAACAGGGFGFFCLGNTYSGGKTLSTLICSQFGIVENFFTSKILGIKKYFLAHSSKAKLKAVKYKSPVRGFVVLFIVGNLML
jgi:hypothetical protein